MSSYCHQFLYYFCLITFIDTVYVLGLSYHKCAQSLVPEDLTNLQREGRKTTPQPNPLHQANPPHLCGAGNRRSPDVRALDRPSTRVRHKKIQQVRVRQDHNKIEHASVPIHPCGGWESP